MRVGRVYARLLHIARKKRIQSIDDVSDRKVDVFCVNLFIKICRRRRFAVFCRRVEFNEPRKRQNFFFERDRYEPFDFIGIDSVIIELDAEHRIASVVRFADLYTERTRDKANRNGSEYEKRELRTLIPRTQGHGKRLLFKTEKSSGGIRTSTTTNDATSPPTIAIAIDDC